MIPACKRQQSTARSSHMTENSVEPKEVVRKVLAGARWSVVLKILGQAISWLSTIVVVRYISAEDYGLNAMLETILVIFGLVSTMGLESALVQSKRLANDELRSVFGWLLVLNAVIFAICFTVSPFVAHYFNAPRLETLVKAMAFIFLLVPFRVIPNALLDRALDFKLKGQLELATSILTAVCTLVFAYNGAGVWALVAGVIANRVVLACLLMIFRPWMVRPTLSLAAAKKLMKVGGILTASGALGLCADMIPALVAGPRIGAAAFGIFAMAAHFAQLPLAKGMPIVQQVLLPAFSKFQDRRDAATYYMGRVLAVSAMIFFPLLIGTACVSHEFVGVVFGQNWESSALPLSIMSGGMAFRLCSQLFKSVITSMGGIKFSLYLNTLQITLLLVLTYAGLDKGAIGLAAAWAATEFFVLLASVFVSKSVLDTRFVDFIRAIIPGSCCSAIMAICIILSHRLIAIDTAGIQLLLSILIGATSYLLAAFLLFPALSKVVVRTATGKE